MILTHLSDFPPRRCMTHGLFIVGSPTQIKARGVHQKYAWKHRHFPIRAPQTTNNKLNPTQFK